MRVRRIAVAAAAGLAASLTAVAGAAQGLDTPAVVRVAEVLRHADPQLETLLPETLGGILLTMESQAGPDLSSDSAPFDAFLASLGKAREDFTLASAYARGGGLKAEVGAWRVRGAETAQLLPAFRQVVQASSATPLTIAEETVGDRAVTRIGDPGQLTRGPLYVVVRGDALLFVQTPDPALAGEAMAKLPE